jgi:hemolysin activation/secretion protein
MMKMRRIPIAGLARICAVAGLFFLNPNHAGAQPSQFPEEHPNENWPPLPAYRSPTAPTLTAPAAPSAEPLSAQARVFVRRFQLSGNTVFSDQALAQVTAPYENRTITSEELQEVRHKLTLYYVERGYINLQARSCQENPEPA